jgi:hypothetical protein
MPAATETLEKVASRVKADSIAACHCQRFESPGKYAGAAEVNWKQ